MIERSGAMARRWAAALLLAGMGVVGNASATLMDRGPDMVYDNVLNITWTRQAGDGVVRNWADSVAWANTLVFAGFNDWRLPYASVAAGAGPTADVYACSGAGGADEVFCRDNEMGYMYYYDLGGTFGQNKTGNQTAAGGQMLTGIQSEYWSGTAFNSGLAWGFAFANGTRTLFGKDNGFEAWAVRPGDVAAAPEPASLLLIGVGMLGLGWSRRSGRRGA